MSDQPILSEQYPSPAILTLLYTVGISDTATGTIFCMNTDNIEDHVSVALVPNGQSLSSKSYIAYDTLIYHGQSLYLQQIFLNSGDKIYVKSQNGTSSFIFTGTLNPTTI